MTCADTVLNSYQTNAGTWVWQLEPWTSPLTLDLGHCLISLINEPVHNRRCRCIIHWSWSLAHATS